MSDPPYTTTTCSNESCNHGTDTTTLTTCEDCEGTGTERYCGHGILENEWCPRCPSGGV